MISSVVRTVLVYLAVVVAMRLMGTKILIIVLSTYATSLQL